MLYYRSDLLEEADFTQPPRTWDELKEQARTVQERSGTQYGFVFQGADYEGGVVNALEYIWTSGGNVLEGDQEVVINSPEARRGLEIERSMIEDGIAPPRALPSTRSKRSPRSFSAGTRSLCATSRACTLSPPTQTSRA